jgi:hypothetical protein
VQQVRHVRGGRTVDEAQVREIVGKDKGKADKSGRIEQHPMLPESVYSHPCNETTLHGG